MPTQGEAVSSDANWSDREFEELLRRASELARNQENSGPSVLRLRAAFTSNGEVRPSFAHRNIAASPERRLGRFVLWLVVMLACIAAAGYTIARTLYK
jgi:hypothetical protein